MKPDRIWWAAATVLVVAGLLLLPLTERSVPAALLSAAAGLLVVAVASTVRRAISTSWLVALPRALGDALLAVVFTLALQGWVAFVGPLPAAGGVLLLVATSPLLVWWLRRRRRPGRPGSRARRGDRAAREVGPPPMPLLQPRDVAAMTTAAIGVSWRRTTHELPRTKEPRRRAQLAELRRLFLDELERRDHDGFRSWLDAGPRAAHDPTGYIDPGAPPSLAY